MQHGSPKILVKRPAQRCADSWWRGLGLFLLALATGACGHQQRIPTPAGPTPAAPVASPPRALWLGPARVYSDTVWFAEELEPIADAVAEFLARPDTGGYRLIPNPTLRALWSDVQQGKLPGVPFTCTAQPPPALLAELLYPDALKGTVEVRCEGQACRLEVVIVETGARDQGAQEDRELARFAADLSPRETPAQWAERIRSAGLQQQAPPPQGGGGLGLRGGWLGPGTRPGTYAIVGDLTMSGGWAFTLDSALFQPLADQLQACRADAPVWRDWWSQELVIEVSASGQLSRCEPSLPDRLPPPGFGCLCETIRQLDFQQGAAQRRASFSLDTTTLRAASRPPDPFFRSVYLTDEHADDPSAILGTGEVEAKALAACLEPLTAPLGEVHVPVSFTVAADGRALAAAANWPQAIAPRVAACLGQVLERARFNCPLSGQAKVTAALYITVEPRRKPR